MSWNTLRINKIILNIVIEKLGFVTPTPVQAKCIPEFLSRKDVIVEAPTGSGKTLAYVIPILNQLALKEPMLKKHEVGSLILVPNRELALQVSEVLQHFLNSLQLACMIFIGGPKIDDDVKKFSEQGANIVVATPGRLDELFEQFSKANNNLFITAFKTLDVLILDEADRLFEKTFEKSLTSILEKLPKQRRVGLFSATQTDYQDELQKVSMRNPVKIAVRDDANGHNSRAPTTLQNFYTIVDPAQKFAALCRFIKQHKKEKILVFVSSCACVDYFSRLLDFIVNKNLASVKKQSKNQKRRRKGKKAPAAIVQILSIHRKKRKKRANVFDQFKKCTGSCVLVCTDVMARGIDFIDVDWVVQFDVPRSVNFFLHRCGRTARSGQSGSALIFLLPSEAEYTDFLKRNQKVDLEQLKIELDKDAAQNMLQKIRKFAAADRSLLVKGTLAFVSFIQAYSKHDCHVVCQLKDLDVVNVAHAFGLLRLPKMPELRDRDLSGFKRCDVNTADIGYKDAKLEQARQDKKQQRQQAAIEVKQRKLTGKKPQQSSVNTDSAAAAAEETAQVGEGQRRKRTAVGSTDVEDDYKLIKKLKRGKMTKNEFDEEFLK